MTGYCENKIQQRQGKPFLAAVFYKAHTVANYSFKNGTLSFKIFNITANWLSEQSILSSLSHFVFYSDVPECTSYRMQLKSLHFTMI